VRYCTEEHYSMDKAVADLIRISNVTGKDPALVMGGGGNTSVKTDDGKYMYIKASGTALKDMNDKKGWRRLRLAAVLSILNDKDIAYLEDQKRETEVVNRLLRACEDDVKGDDRPSVESHLHALLDRCVIHLHPLVVSAFVNAKNGQVELEKLFADEAPPPLWVPYADPGYMLAKKIAKLVGQYTGQHGRKPRILFLAKHGVFVTANKADEALRLVRRVIKSCSSKLKTPKAHPVSPLAAEEIVTAKLAIRKGVFEATGQYLPVSYFTPTDIVRAFLARRDAARLLAVPALHPEEIVYANGPAVWLNTADAATVVKKLTLLLQKGCKPASAFLVKDAGFFVAADKRLSALVAEMAEGSLLVRMHAVRFGGVVGLNSRQQEFVNNWESEAFRRKQACGQNRGELENRIAVVSGAGSGLGRSIAIGLSRVGAMVCLADIDQKSAEETAKLITSELPSAQTMVLGCNVTDEMSVQKVFAAVLANWGGLDILVNAAGVAPAYPLVELPVDKWRFALEVNLTGYFLMAREAAQIMIQQAMGGNIINVSSKSGLDASKNNTPYNATKAGEIHIARGWALELGEHGIRVNSVAPGNVFEGSKIWNPKYIKVCAAKYGIKPEEVIPYYVGKTALKREIKGQDVADAVVFLCSDKARTITGQTLVPDSGQVMVR
jgi:NAD(P)-dependent dehydrogenase (short-subunit alcohol dehydrogenase family)/rhamnose utilization protein RhaD (predicted bifunctional aldolase and dehydrogenase)